jgi:glucose-1-phosphate adenylyltransferase
MGGIHGKGLPKTLSVILGGGRGTRLFPLTKERAKPAVPVAGKYRLIDVPISNCLNSGLNKIYVITQFQSESLHRHVQGTYRFDRFGEGFVELLAAQQTNERSDWYQGTADAVRANIVHLQDRPSDEMLILSGDQLYRMDFQELLANHRKHEADISIAVLPVAARDADSLGILKVDSSGRVVDFKEKPDAVRRQGMETDPALFAEFGIEAPGRPYLASMGIYVFKTQVLIKQLTEKPYVDFGKHLFPAVIHTHRVQAFLFDDYWEDIGTVKSFHVANLELARMPSRFSFSDDEGPIYTRPRMLPPAIAARLSMTDSIVGEGCRIGDLVMENSVLGNRSVVGANVRLIRTLVMGADGYESDHERAHNRIEGIPDMGIGDNVTIEDAIVDKDARIGADSILRPPPGGDRDGEFYAVRDGVLCIFKGATVPCGTRIGV